jgi:hypothetical protein
MYASSSGGTEELNWSARKIRGDYWLIRWAVGQRSYNVDSPSATVWIGHHLLILVMDYPCEGCRWSWVESITITK